MISQLDTSFFENKRILLTGHSGFKGTWLSKILINFGAEVTGYSLCTKKDISLFEISGNEKKMNSIKGDIRDFNYLNYIFNETKPEIVIHMAAQPIVSIGYDNPLYTYETNVMGTVNILECVKKTNSVHSFINITTDKVYENKEWEWGYRENEPLDGFDPYSNSKSCSELVTHCYNNSFFKGRDIGVSTARAGNVIGGGDFALNRIVPDCVRAAIKGNDIIVRNPHSTRPYQHVLEPLFVYLQIVMKQYNDKKYAGYYNVGPYENDCIETCELVELFCKKWGNNIHWLVQNDKVIHEANRLKLDCSRLRMKFNWKPKWSIDTSIEETIAWYKSWANNEDISFLMDKQITKYHNEG